MKRRRLPVGEIPPGDGSLQPEAVGAVVEVTKLLKYFDVTGHLG